MVRVSRRPSTPRLTVVMPMYNAGRFVHAAVGSVLGQSFRDFRLVIIDDGSQDDGFDIVSGFDDARVELVRHERNQGISATMNEGLAMADTEYVAVMDADDICVPGRLESQVRYLDTHPQFVGCGTDLMARRADGGEEHWRYPRDPREIAAGMLLNSTVAHATLMVRRGFLETHGLRYDEGLERAQDYALLARLSRLGPLTNLSRVGYVYNLHDSGKSANWLDQTRATSAVIRAGLAKQVGLPGFDQCAAVHEFIATAGSNGDARSIGEVVAWLEQAHRANASTRIWTPDALDRVLRERFYLLFGRLNWPLARLWREMRRASLFGGPLMRGGRVARLAASRTASIVRGKVRRGLCREVS